jgi:maleate isomerase
MYGYRARIGYTAAAVTTEVLPIDFYKIVPDGVSLMMIGLPIGQRSGEDLSRSYDAAVAGAKVLAENGADLVLLGGLPVNLAHGIDKLEELLRRLEGEIGVQVSSNATLQRKAYKALGARKVGSVHPFTPEHGARYETYLRDVFGLDPVGLYAGGKDLKSLGKLPIDNALEWGRALQKAHPEMDTLHFACPHWRVIDAIEPLEQELKVNVMSSLQAIAWEAMRRTGVNDRIEGYGRLLREF